MDQCLISVIIPVFNDPQGLENSVNSLLRQDYDSNIYEIIIINNRSTDKTIDKIHELKRKNPDIIFSYSEDFIQSPAAARNKGIKKCKGIYLAFIDSDMTVEDQWLRKITKLVINKDYYYTGCRINMYYKSKNIISLYNSITGFPTEKYLFGKNYSPTGGLIVKKDLFNKVGFFDNRLITGEDDEFGKRVHKYGIEQHYVSEIYLNHPADISFTKSIKRWFRSGIGSMLMYYYYPELYNNLILVPLNPYNYFPPNPFKFIRSVDRNKWDKIKPWKKICLYFIQWLVKLVRVIGYTYGLLKQNKNKEYENINN